MDASTFQHFSQKSGDIQTICNFIQITNQQQQNNTIFRRPNISLFCIQAKPQPIFGLTKQQLRAHHRNNMKRSGDQGEDKNKSQQTKHCMDVSIVPVTSIINGVERCDEFPWLVVLV